MLAKESIDADSECSNPDCLHRRSRHSEQGICMALACPCKAFKVANKLRAL